MKPILITQRVDFIPEYSEYRDALDQRWIALLLDAGLFPILVPNNPCFIDQILASDLNHSKYNGVILTGGNSLHHFGGDSPVRDDIENQLLTWAIKRQKPILGVCRGMQLIQHYFNNELQSINDHINVEKTLHINTDNPLTRLYRQIPTVRVFHTLASLSPKVPLQSLASDDGVNLAIQHQDKAIYGMMWHPERETNSRAIQIKILQHIFRP